MRLMPQQDCPALKNAPSVSDSTACTRLASARTYAGSLPPNSSPDRAKPAAVDSTTARPPATEPVKHTLLTRASAMRRAVSPCDRCRYWNTPWGTPAEAKASAKRSAHETCLDAGIDRGKRLRGDTEHVARPLFKAADLARRMADRTTHLPSDLL